MKYSTILVYKYPNQEWSIVDENYETLTWLSDTPKPTKAELDAQWDEVQAKIETDKAEAAAKRQAILNRLGITEEEAKLILG
jgi:hypothetical protein